jgi:hypothetical protein
LSAASAQGKPPPHTSARGDLIYVAMVAAVALAVMLVNAFSTADDLAAAGRPTPLWKPLVWEATSTVVVVVLAPLILLLTRRAWPLDRPRLRIAAAHAAGALGFSLLHVALMGALRGVVYALAGDAYDPLGPLADWPYELRKDLLTYAILVSAYVAWRLLRRPLPPPEAPPGELEVRDGARRHFLRLDEVAWVEAAGNYVELHRGASPILHRAPLSEMERQLAPAGFVRIHRSRLVRRSAISQVESKPSGDFVVRLADGRELAGSRRYRRSLLTT